MKDKIELILCETEGVSKDTEKIYALRYQIAREVIEEWREDGECHDPYSIAGGQGAFCSFDDWLDQQEEE